MKHRRNQRLASQLPEIIAPCTAWGSDNVVRNVPQWYGNSYWNISPILSKIPDIFKFTMLSSRFTMLSSQFHNVEFTMVRKLLYGNVEFALHPQHEASCDSEIQTGKDSKNKFRKQLESSPTTSLNSEGKEETLECLKS